MADQDHDLKVPQRVSQSYRALGAEEPPRALDDAILAAARREAGARPAALAARASRQRWYAPLATAAVLVLAVAVTMHMRIEQPGIESPAPQAVSPPAVEKEAAKELTAKVAKEVAKPVIAEEVRNPRRKSAAQPAPAIATAPAAADPRPFAAEQAAASASRSDESGNAVASVTGSLARPAQERTSRDAQSVARAPQAAPMQALAKRAEQEAAPSAAASPPPAARSMSLRERSAEPTPERELERIAELRAQGRHDEADKALAEFRKRHPDFRIPATTLERVERR